MKKRYFSLSPTSKSREVSVNDFEHHSELKNTQLSDFPIIHEADAETTDRPSNQPRNSHRHSSPFSKLSDLETPNNQVMDSVIEFDNTEKLFPYAGIPDLSNVEMPKARFYHSFSEDIPFTQETLICLACARYSGNGVVLRKVCHNVTPRVEIFDYKPMRAVFRHAGPNRVRRQDNRSRRLSFSHYFDSPEFDFAPDPFCDIIVLASFALAFLYAVYVCNFPLIFLLKSRRSISRPQPKSRIPSRILNPQTEVDTSSSIGAKRLKAAFKNRLKTGIFGHSRRKASLRQQPTDVQPSSQLSPESIHSGTVVDSSVVFRCEKCTKPLGKFKSFGLKKEGLFRILIMRNKRATDSESDISFWTSTNSGSDTKSSRGSSSCATLQKCKSTILQVGNALPNVQTSTNGLKIGNTNSRKGFFLKRVTSFSLKRLFVGGTRQEVSPTSREPSPCTFESREIQDSGHFPQAGNIPVYYKKKSVLELLRIIISESSYPLETESFFASTDEIRLKKSFFQNSFPDEVFTREVTNNNGRSQQNAQHFTTSKPIDLHPPGGPESTSLHDAKRKEEPSSVSIKMQTNCLSQGIITNPEAENTQSLFSISVEHKMNSFGKIKCGTLDSLPKKRKMDPINNPRLFESVSDHVSKEPQRGMEGRTEDQGLNENGSKRLGEISQSHISTGESKPPSQHQLSALISHFPLSLSELCSDSSVPQFPMTKILMPLRISSLDSSVNSLNLGQKDESLQSTQHGSEFQTSNGPKVRFDNGLKPWSTSKKGFPQKVICTRNLDISSSYGCIQTSKQKLLDQPAVISSNIIPEFPQVKVDNHQLSAINLQEHPIHSVNCTRVLLSPKDSSQLSVDYSGVSKQTQLHNSKLDSGNLNLSSCGEKRNFQQEVFPQIPANNTTDQPIQHLATFSRDNLIKTTDEFSFHSDSFSENPMDTYFELGSKSIINSTSLFFTSREPEFRPETQWSPKKKRCFSEKQSFNNRNFQVQTRRFVDEEIKRQTFVRNNIRQIFRSNFLHESLNKTTSEDVVLRHSPFGLLQKVNRVSNSNPLGYPPCIQILTLNRDGGLRSNFFLYKNGFLKNA